MAHMQLILYCLCLALRIPDLITPPVDPPFIQKPKERIEKDKIESLETIKERSAQEEYELGLLYILAGELDLGKSHIEKALFLKSKFLEARIQLGFINLWENDLESANLSFREALIEEPCDKRALFGLQQFARSQSNAVAREIYLEILSCDPKNLDCLFFLGQTAPKYEDAVVALARIYERQNDAEALRKLSQQYPQVGDLQRIYARFLVSRENFSEAS